jgi:hypothetical protein
MVPVPVFAASALAGVTMALPSHMTAAQLSVVVKEPAWPHVYVTTSVKPAEQVKTTVLLYACVAA